MNCGSQNRQHILKLVLLGQKDQKVVCCLPPVINPNEIYGNWEIQVMIALVYSRNFFALIYEFACVLNHESFLLAFLCKHLSSFQVQALNEQACYFSPKPSWISKMCFCLSCSKTLLLHFFLPDSKIAHQNLIAKCLAKCMGSLGDT